jgi:hypothetical protein
MKHSEDLFALIKSLDNNEKRYFKLYSSKYHIKDGSNYLQLFNEMNGQKEYDEVAIRKKFSDKTFVKQLTVAKYKLYYQILKALESYHSNYTTKIQIKSLLNYAGILFDKLLYMQARKVMLKAKKMAIENEHFLLEAEAIALERKINSSERFAGKIETDVDAIYKEEKNALKKCLSIARYDWLYTRLRLRPDKEGLSRKEETAKKYENILKDNFLSDDSKSISVYTKYRSSATKASYFFISKDYGTAERITDETLQLLEENTFFIRDDIGYYIHTLRNSIVCKLYQKKYAGIPSLLEKLKTLKSRSLRTSVQLFFISNVMELNFYCDIKDFEKGAQLIPHIEDRLQGPNIYYQEILVLYYYISYTYFAIGEFQQAKKWVNKILNYDVVELRSDIFSFAKIFNLIIHTELDNQELLEYALKSTYRYLYKKNSLYKVETIILKFIRDNMRITDKKILIREFKKSRKLLLELSKDAYENTALAYFDYISWLDSKIEGRTFAEVVKRRMVKL